MLLTEQDVKGLTAKILSMVTADDATVSVGSNKQSHLRFAGNNVLTSGMREGRSANVTLWIGGKRGSASTSDLDEASLRAMVEKATTIAKGAPVDREYVPTLGKQTYKPVNGYFDATANLSLTERAKQIGAILSELEKSKVIGAGFHSATAQAGGSATKNGNFEFERSSGVGLSVTARTPDGGSSGYFMRSHDDIARLDTMRIARESIRKALEGRDPKAIQPGVYTVILEPQAVVDLIGGGLGNALNARSAEEGRRAFSVPGGKTRLGEKVFDEKANYEAGSIKEILMHDGTEVRLHKLAKDWDPFDRLSAVNAMQRAKRSGEILTGLLYMDEGSSDLHDMIGTTDTPLNALSADRLCPGSAALESLNSSLR